jgi:hypothetical protein
MTLSYKLLTLCFSLSFFYVAYKNVSSEMLTNKGEDATQFIHELPVNSDVGKCLPTLGFNVTFILGCAMAQAVSHRPLTAEAVVRARVNPCGICGHKVALGQVSLRVPRFPLSILFHCRSPNSYHLGMNNMSVSVSSSET